MSRETRRFYTQTLLIDRKHEKYNVSNKSAQEARYHDAANDMCYLILLWPAHTQQSALAHHLCCHILMIARAIARTLGLKLCVSVSPTTGQRGASRVGASCLVRTSRNRQHEQCNARTCRWQVNDVYGTFFPMKLTCADAIKSKQTHVSAGMLRMTL